MNAARPLLVAAVLALSSCSKPEPPTVTPISGRVSAISTTGITVDAKLEAYNPNEFERLRRWSFLASRARRASTATGDRLLAARPQAPVPKEEAVRHPHLAEMERRRLARAARHGATATCLMKRAAASR